MKLVAATVPQLYLSYLIHTRKCNFDFLMFSPNTNALTLLYFKDILTFILWSCGYDIV
jgi:hypothetical protein